jgi:hypothetical protein
VFADSVCHDHDNSLSDLISAAVRGLLICSHLYLASGCVLFVSLMSTHASVLVDSVGPPNAEVCRAAASFP